MEYVPGNLNLKYYLLSTLKGGGDESLKRTNKNVNYKSDFISCNCPDQIDPSDQERISEQKSLLLFVVLTCLSLFSMNSILNNPY